MPELLDQVDAAQSGFVSKLNVPPPLVDCEPFARFVCGGCSANAEAIGLV